MKNSKLIMSFLFLILGMFVHAQNSPDYQYTFDGQVKWMILTNTGTLLTSTGEALVGIKPNLSEVSFKIERLKKVKEENLEFVSSTPYLIIKPQGIIKHTAVVDLIKGKLVFDSKAENWQGGVTSRYFIEPEMMFVVNGMHKEEGKGQYKQGVGLYDLKTGNLVRVFERKGANIMSGRPDIMGDDIIIPGAKDITCYSISSGSVKWKSAVKNATSIITNDESKEIYAFRTKGTNSVVYKVNADGGSLIWSEANKIKGIISQIKFTDHGLAIVTNIVSSGKKGLVGGIANAAKGSGTSKVYLLDFKSGVDLWEKSPKTKGIINHFYIEDDGILFGVASGGVNKISFEGKALWKKPLKTGPNIQIMATVPTGLLYISQTDTDIIDMSTGNSVFGKAIKYKRSEVVASTFDKERDRFLITCKDGVYEVDGNNGAYSLLTNSTSFEGKEVPNSISIRKNGILLASDQNLTLLDFSGKEIWHVYHRPPGKSAFGAIAMGVLAVASTAVAASNSYAAGSLKGSGVPSYNSTVRRLEGISEDASKIADEAFKEMLKRFKATKSTENAAFILTKINKDIGLVKVDKDTGQKVYDIVLNDKDPVYEVDDIEGVLYYKSKNNTISAYKLNK